MNCRLIGLRSESSLLLVVAVAVSPHSSSLQLCFCFRQFVSLYYGVSNKKHIYLTPTTATSPTRETPDELEGIGFMFDEKYR